jgi:hypothetical protein
MKKQKEMVTAGWHCKSLKRTNHLLTIQMELICIAQKGEGH